MFVFDIQKLNNNRDFKNKLLQPIGILYNNIPIGYW